VRRRSAGHDEGPGERRAGARPTLQCVGYCSASSHGAHFDRDRLRRIAALGLVIDIDFYYVDDPHEQDGARQAEERRGADDNRFRSNRQRAARLSNLPAVSPEQFPGLLDAALIARGIDLMPTCGAAEFAWSRQDALAVIEAARLAGLRVLGGDVLRRSDLGIEPTNDNWHSDQDDTESNESFAVRSCDEARSYVGRYRQRGDDALLFVLVVA
jgi:hypothetical protein